jgi:hypothetical protein
VLTEDGVGFVLYLATLPVSKPAFHKLLSLGNISGLEITDGNQKASAK